MNCFLNKLTKNLYKIKNIVRIVTAGLCLRFFCLQ
nr:MAG TPA: hypothetical protein [Caudoviricetes sp.]